MMWFESTSEKKEALEDIKNRLEAMKSGVKSAMQSLGISESEAPSGIETKAVFALVEEISNAIVAVSCKIMSLPRSKYYLGIAAVHAMTDEENADFAAAIAFANANFGLEYEPEDFDA